MKFKLAKDKWLGTDKLIHFAACLIITLIWGEASAGIAGVFKEIADSHPNGSGFSYKDLVFDGLGIGLGMVIRNTFYV